MTSAAATAAARLQELLHSFLSHDPEHGVKKFVPDSCRTDASSSPPSYTIVLDAAEMLEHLPFYAASLAPRPSFSNGTAVTSTSLLQFIGSVVERHLHTFIHDIATGPSFVDLSHTSSLAFKHDATANDTSSAEEEEDGSARSSVEAAAAPPCSGYDGGYRVNFVAWVALEVYRHLATEAAVSLRERQVSAGAAAALDAGVRTATYVQWESALHERLASAVPRSAAVVVEEGEGGGVRGEHHHSSEGAKVQRAAAAAFLPIPLEAYHDVDDVFTNEPHFFSSFIRKHLLPCIRQHVMSARTEADAATPAATLRQWLRSPAATAMRSPAFPACDSDSVHVGAECQQERGEEKVVGRTRASSFPTHRWQQLVQLALGSSIKPTLEGQDVYDASGLLRPQTPVQAAAYAAAAVVVSLTPAVVGPATRWLDQTLSSICDSRSTGDLVKSKRCRRANDDEEAECAEAMRRALNTCTRSVQVIPFPLCDGHDADVHAEAQIAGGWLLPSSFSPMQVQCQGTYGQGIHTPRGMVVLPGLAVAATRIRSIAAELLCATHACGGGGARPDAATPGGTCVVSPAGALAQLGIHGAQLDEAAVAASTTTPAVSVLDASSLRCVEWMLLFTELPGEREQLEKIRASVNAAVCVGWVLLIVQRSVAKATLSWVESSWGSAQRPVLLLSAVGQWGLQQLSLRFEARVNTAFTDPRALRGVRRSGKDSNWPVGQQQQHGDHSHQCCGVATLLVGSHKYAPSASMTVASTQSGRRESAALRGGQARQQIVYTELREHVLVVVGVVVQKEAEGAVREGAVGRACRSTDKSEATPTLQQRTPATHPSLTSMRFADTSEEDEETPESSSGSISSSSSNSSFSAHSTGSTTPSLRERAAQKAVRWYCCGGGLPPLPSVTHSVLVGATTRGSQRELTYHFWCWWRHLLHQLVLPPGMGTAVPAQGSRCANVAAMRWLDAWTGSGGETEVKAAAAATRPCSDRTLLPPRHRHLLRVLRQALWSYELLATQHDGEGKGVDEAWTALQRWVEVDGDSPGGSLAKCEVAHSAIHVREPPLAPFCTHTESWLQVQSAFIALGNCMDELCSTVVLVGDRDSVDDAAEANTGTTGLSFLPMI
jgi:hypothetical protein